MNFYGGKKIRVIYRCLAFGNVRGFSCACRAATQPALVAHTRAKTTLHLLTSLSQTPQQNRRLQWTPYSMVCPYLSQYYRNLAKIKSNCLVFQHLWFISGFINIYTFTENCNQLQLHFIFAIILSILGQINFSL